ncbi:PIG-L deacetylase family protein [Mycolicibacterium sediminis]|uniref:Acetylglucosaminylphosphatidylinositol deacetylase n=1 Tax=Mycolicibacterium sediminis TaxID=1286180 RepID=A0A7I7QZ82_9MYCO|nr:PIG-L family deacetylase [Mycolicibacterium sediminis]BBY31674.1 acetylglucosaminylphosphatidylinositol deacetylase [Mycolicibacterium sediminis]
MTNGPRFAARPIDQGGTPTSAWLARRPAFPELDLSGCPALTVVAPHPDDETLGFGATAATLRERGIPVRIVSVTDGGGAYPHSHLDRGRLERDRRAEGERAAETLGLDPPISLGLPDGELTQHVSALTDALGDLLSGDPPGSWCAATWRGDGHPDHEAVGLAAAEACADGRARLLEYPVWMWHWALPDDEAVPWHRMSAVPLESSAVARKRSAIAAFETQLTASPSGEAAVLPPFVVDRLLAVGEVVFA